MLAKDAGSHRRILAGMTSSAIAGLLIPLAVPIGRPTVQAQEARLDAAALRAHVEELASPAYEGRRGAGAIKAADYVERKFREIGLKPLFDASFRQIIPGKAPGDPDQGRNIGGMIEGSDPALAGEFVVLAAHFDHLGVRNGKIHPGADDDASGVAMLVESARTLRNAARKPKRTLVFVAFDLEEVGLFGSRYFANHPPIALDRICVFICADMIGRSLAGVCKKEVFVIGSEHVAEAGDWLKSGALGLDLAIGILGADIVGTRSDYGPFWNRKIPFLFFSTGENPLYHTPGDVPETLDYEKLRSIATLMERVTESAANAAKGPVWTEPLEPSMEETRTIRDVMRILLDNADALKIGFLQRNLMTTTIKNADGYLAKGKITEQERAEVARAARLILFTVL